MIHALLSALMFIQLFVIGSYSPILSLYLTRLLGLSGEQAALVMSISQLSMLISPLIIGRIADRWLSVKSLLIIIYLTAAGLLVLTATRRDFTGVMISFFLVNLSLGPSIGLLNTATFKRLADPKSFGNIRVWGTVGWIAAGWVNGLAVRYLPSVENSMSPAFYFAAISAMLFASLAALLPQADSPAGRRPPGFLRRRTGASQQQGSDPAESGSTERRSSLDARPRVLKFMVSPKLRAILAAYAAAGVIERFYVFGAGPLLSSIGLKDSMLMPVLGIGQMSEAIMLILLQRVLRRLSYRKTIIGGALLLSGRFILLLAASRFAGAALPLSIGAVALHGLIYALFYTAITVYIDDSSTPEQRPVIHQYLSILLIGIAGFAGNSLAGGLFPGGDRYSGSFTVFWLVPAITALLITGGLGVFFRPSETPDCPDAEKPAN